jgi:class 3 adenylate cyclase
LSEVASSFDSKVIKTNGDSIICYFPETIDCNNRLCFKKVLECGLEMIEARFKINSKLHAETLPAISYRISADYGKHEVVKMSKDNSEVKDLIGTTMNICSKINSMAAPNSMTIGGALYEIVRSSCPEFCFENAGEYFTGLRSAYPMYSVSRRARYPNQQPSSAAEPIRGCCYRLPLTFEIHDSCKVVRLLSHAERHCSSSSAGSGKRTPCLHPKGEGPGRTRAFDRLHDFT